MTFGFRQLLLLWLAVFVLMGGAFIAGVRAGREQGLRLALEEQSTPVLKIPIARNAPQSESVSALSVASAPTPAQSDISYNFSPEAKSQIPEAPEPVVEKPAAVKSTPKEEAVLAQPAEPASTGYRVVAKRKNEPVPAAQQKASPGRAWFVQVAATDTRSEATALMTRLKTMGYSATVRDAKIDDVMYYRVLVGPFSSRAEADTVSKKLTSKSVGKGQPFIKNM